MMGVTERPRSSTYVLQTIQTLARSEHRAGAQGRGGQPARCEWRAVHTQVALLSMVRKVSGHTRGRMATSCAHDCQRKLSVWRI